MNNDSYGKKIMPLNTHSFTSYPLPENGEGVIEITAEEFERLKSREAMFSDDLKSVIPCEKPAETNFRRKLDEPNA